MRLIIDDQVTESARRTAAAIPTARRSLLTRLAGHLMRGAMEKSSGPASAPAGSYPIPIRTKRRRGQKASTGGSFRGSFGLQVGLSQSVVFNTSLYARALHEGFQPYGNPHASPIPARRYFDDALNEMDIPEIVASWEDSLPWR